MSTNVLQFNKALEASAKKIHGDFEKFYKAVCIECLKRIVFRTPVKTGRARGNWQVEIGSAASGTLEVSGSQGDMANSAMSAGIAKLSDIPAWSIVHLTNNIEYLYYLEYDRRSSQFPEGMIEITLTEMTTWLWGIK